MASQHVSFEELQAFILDEAPLNPAAQEHLDGCSDCQKVAACSQEAITYLVAQLYRSQCPSATTLSHYCLLNALTAEEQRQVTSHLVDCPLCLEEFAVTRQFLATSE